MIVISYDLYRFLNNINYTLNWFVENEIWVIFVDGVICKMHVIVLKIVCSWCCVRLCSKTSQTLLIYKYSQRICTSHKHINSHIKFQPINQKWFMKISLNHAFLIFKFWIIALLLSICLVRNMPLPWQLAYGFTIKVWAFPDCLLSW